MTRHRSRNLLLCFDAFGTLIAPKRPVPQQYGEVARQLGLSGFSDDEIKSSFKNAFGQMSRAHPNYGRASSMGAEAWWTSIIHQTFEPLLRQGQSIPRELAPRLLHRFSSNEGYQLLDPDLPRLLRALRGSSAAPSTASTASPMAPAQDPPLERIVIGVITNSDDRIPSVLSSLGLRVSPLRWDRVVAGASIGENPDSSDAANGRGGGRMPAVDHDIDFCCMSYDVGLEKPDANIFRAARSMCDSIQASERVGQSPHETAEEQAPADWTSIYVGDNYDHDVVGALNVGWHGLLLGGATDGAKTTLPEFTTAISSLDDLFAQSNTAFRLESVTSLLKWLVDRA